MGLSQVGRLVGGYSMAGARGASPREQAVLGRWRAVVEAVLWGMQVLSTGGSHLIRQLHFGACAAGQVS